jgi:NosR/NirI family transcriptional regulator, nitrous oxide reductase regulator
MSALPIIEAPTPRTSGWKTGTATLLRCAVVLSIAVAVRLHHERHTGSVAEISAPINIADVKLMRPAAEKIGPSSGGLQPIYNGRDELLGYATTTLPVAAKVVGYRGPSNVLLILDEQSSVMAAKLISSDDTPEHVTAIDRDTDFFKQFEGWTQGQPETFGPVDATTGATLTSLAIAEGLAVRLGSEKPSLRFPDELQTADLQLVFDNPEKLQLRAIDIVEADVLSEVGTVIGKLVRTGPLVDSIAGYQGPSELVASLSTDGTVLKIALRRTYDNQPYTDYLNDEPYFWKVFHQKTIGELQQLDLQEERIEGVSGATMTSLAVAETIVAAARSYAARKTQAGDQIRRSYVRWTSHDVGTTLVLCGGVLIGLTRLRGRRWVRILWNIILIAYFGLVTGNLISLAVVAGWAAQGIGWRLAPGLALVILLSLLLPPITRRNLYCSHLCPHGAAQQLLRNRWKTNWKISHAMSRRLKWLPGIILVVATVATLLGRTWNLAAWEPFNAYVWYVAGASSLTLAVASLLVSAAVPMAYCRYMCATGRLLDFLRRSAASARFSLADGITVAVAAAAWATWLRS